MEKRLQISLLLDLYNVLLTDKQKDVMDLYFNKDLSLAEIAEDKNTSRQAIYDIIKRCEKLLTNYEAKLNLLYKQKYIKNIKSRIMDNLNLVIEKENSKIKIQSIVNKIIKDLKEIK